ncbi:Hypothetical predicted protein [Octopus vulgaris]|uniref:Uncharacterized protein n=1 Tax=Octopus vulgaris TaxID=6645 RepID=A0AA36C1D5_OCTVU|nr:Hypothetical predicted protein [Octopus vulgaris]
MTPYRLLMTPYRLLMTPYRLLMTVRLDVPPTVSADILATAMVHVIYINRFTTKKLKITIAAVHRTFCSLVTVGTGWKKVFKMTKDSFERSPMYLYWDDLPIKQVKFQLTGTTTFTFIFNRTETTSTSWFRVDKAIVNPLKGRGRLKFDFKGGDPEFVIKINNTHEFRAKFEKGRNKVHDISARRLSDHGYSFRCC